MTTERDLIQQLTERLDHLHSNYDLPSQSALIAEALDYLDQPEPEYPSDQELLELMTEQHRATESEWYCLKARTCGDKADQVAYSTIRELLHRIEALEAATTAQPEPEGPTVMEIIALADEIEAEGLGQVDLVRRALTRWGK